ncbi:MAG: hypothetical protein ACPGWS_05745 [Solirubrobacterales bacterium]
MAAVSTARSRMRPRTTAGSMLAEAEYKRATTDPDLIEHALRARSYREWLRLEGHSSS